MQDIWKCGHIRPDSSDKTIKFEVRSIQDLVDKVIPHFEEFPLLSSKQKDFELFKKICSGIFLKEHLTVDGLIRTVEWAMEMNPTGKRKYPGNEILNSLRADEGIVYASSNRG